MESDNYLLNIESASSLNEPHGGTLVDRVIKIKPEAGWLKTLPKIQLDENSEMDVEQIAIGAFSPLEGFMNKNEVMRLGAARASNKLSWTPSPKARSRPFVGRSCVAA